MSAPNATTGRLCEFLAGRSGASLPSSVQEAAVQHVLDTLAAVVSGTTLEPGRAGARIAQQLGGPAVSTLFATGTRVGPHPAALGNGMAAHADETDDSHASSLSHPGCSIVPAALALAESRGEVSGQLFLRAIVAGYDVGCRVGMSLSYESVDLRGSNRSSHALVGTFGSAVAGGVIRGFSPEQFAALLSYASQQAAGLTTWQKDGDHVEKAFVFAGMPAAAGILAALMVGAGCTGLADPFDGAPNALAAFSPAADPAVLLDGLGTRFEIARTNIKKYSVGSPAQAAVQACEELIAEGLDPHRVAGVQVRLPSDLAMVVNARAMPDINVQYLISATLLDGGFSFAMAHDSVRMADPQVVSLMQRVELLADEALLGGRGAHLIFTEMDGRRWEKSVAVVHGSATDPMSLEEVADKARDLIGPALGADGGEALIEAVLALPEATDLGYLAPLLVPRHHS